MSLWLIKLLLAEYLIIGAVALYSRQWGVVLYFAGSAVLTAGILVMR
jgi:hypothetical protein